jgi:Flp pilus assembly protein TadB
VSSALVGAALMAALAVVLSMLDSGHPGAPTERRTRGGSPGQGRIFGPGAGQSKTSAGPGSSTAEPDPGMAPLAVRAVGALAGVAVWLLLGGVVGGVLGALMALMVPVLIGRLEPGRVRRERLELTRTAPLVADLLCAALMAGVPLEHSIPVVARAVGGASGAALLRVHRRTELGEPMAHAWAVLAQAPGLGGIARAVARSSRTGAPLAGLLAHAADDLRADASAAALAEVRTTAVRAVLPLGLCLLPAFALLGIAPIVGGLIPSL